MRTARGQQMLLDRVIEVEIGDVIIEDDIEIEIGDVIIED